MSDSPRWLRRALQRPYQAVRGRWRDEVVMPRRWQFVTVYGLALALIAAEIAAVDALRAAGAPMLAQIAVLVCAFFCLVTLYRRPVQVVSVLLPRRMAGRVSAMQDPYASLRAVYRYAPPGWTELDHLEYQLRSAGFYGEMLSWEIEQYLGGERGEQP